MTNSDPDANHRVSLPLHKAVLDAVLAHKPQAAVPAKRRGTKPAVSDAARPPSETAA